jgi:hypothetical protein
MSDSQMDEIFKNLLSGHESPLPDDMWERIIRGKDKDRKGFFFFLRLSGLFILGFGIAWFLLFGINRNPAGQEGQNVSNSKDKSIPATVNSKTNDQDLAKVNPPGNGTASDSPQRKNNQEVYTGKDSSIDSGRKRYSHRVYANSVNSTDPTRKGYKLKDYTNRASSKENKSAGVPPMKSKKVSAAHLEEGASSAEIINMTDQKSNSTSSSNPTSLNSDSANNSVVKKSDSTVKSLTADSTLKSTVKKSDSVKKVISRKWSLDLYASPDYPIVYGEPWVKTKLSYTAGVRINRSFGNRFSGKIGIQYSQINYNFTDSNGFGSPNHLMSLDLPALAGYSWGNETLGMTINTGVVFNLYSWSNDSPSYFKTNTGLSLYLSFNVKKQISERIDIFTEPYYRYRLSSMTVSSVYYGKFIDVVGLSFGARYHFKK